jgi:hypothetical protein
MDKVESSSSAASINAGKVNKSSSSKSSNSNKKDRKKPPPAAAAAVASIDNNNNNNNNDDDDDDAVEDSSSPQPAPRFKRDGRIFVARNSLSEQALIAEKERARAALEDKDPSLITTADKEQERRTANRLSSFQSRKRRQDIIASLENIVTELHRTNVDKDKTIAHQQAEMQLLQQENTRLHQLAKDKDVEVQNLLLQRTNTATAATTGSSSTNDAVPVATAAVGIESMLATLFRLQNNNNNNSSQNNNITPSPPPPPLVTSSQLETSSIMQPTAAVAAAAPTAASSTTFNIEQSSSSSFYICFSLPIRQSQQQQQ